VGVCDELRRLLSRVGFHLPPVYLRLVAPMSDPKALALLPLQVGVGGVRGRTWGTVFERAGQACALSGWAVDA
jgi:hypothetical protein